MAAAVMQTSGSINQIGSTQQRTRLETERRVCRLTTQMNELKRMSDAMEASCGLTWMCGAVNNKTQEPGNPNGVKTAQQLREQLLVASFGQQQQRLIRSGIEQQQNNRRRVCVIGGGSSGIIVVKELLEAGVDDVVCYEIQEGVGGLYRRDNYEYGAHTSSFCYTSYACFPPEDVSQCGHYTLAGYVKYLEAFVDSFGLSPYLKFKHRVLKVRQECHGGDWLVTIENMNNNEQFTQRFEHVVCCSGTHTNHDDPRKTHRWLDNYQGKVIHSSEYRTPTEYKDKRVVICGGGESASDISVQTAKVAKKTWIAMRARCGHVTPRGAHLPEDDHKDLALQAHKRDPMIVPPEAGFDTDLTVLMYSISPALFPLNGYRDVLALSTKDFYHGCKLNVYHKSNVNSQFGCKNAGWSSAVMRYGCEPKPPIKSCSGKTVRFEDGSSAIDIDAIVLCIGYRNDIVFLDDNIKNKVLNPRNCLKHVAHPEITNFYLCGFVRPAFGNIPSIAEMQARWITNLITGRSKLPPKDEMCTVIEEDRAWEEASYGYAGKKLKALTSYYRQMMDLATMIDAHPDYGQLLFSDPALFLKVIAGQFSGLIFRLRDLDPDVRSRYRSLIMQMPLSGVWTWDLAIVMTAFHAYLLFGSFDRFKLRGNMPFQNLHPVSRRILAVLLFLNPVYLLCAVLPALLVCICCWSFINFNTVRIASNLDGLFGISRPAYNLMKTANDKIHIYYARLQLILFLISTAPFDLALTLTCKKYLLNKSDVPTSTFMEMENNYKKHMAEFAFSDD